MKLYDFDFIECYDDDDYDFDEDQKKSKENVGINCPNNFSILRYVLFTKISLFIVYDRLGFYIANRNENSSQTSL